MGQLSSSTQTDNNMKFLVLAACVAASSASGFFGLQSHPNGAVTPIDEPAVAAAHADHLTTKFGKYGAGYAAAAPVVASAPLAAVAPAAYGYAGPLHVPALVSYPNGAVTPADEPAVAAARAENLKAHGGVYGGVIASAAAAAPLAAVAPAAYGYAGPLHVPTLVSYANGAVTPA